MVLEQFHALKGGTAGDELVGELGLIFIAPTAIDFLVGILGLVWRM